MNLVHIESRSSKRVPGDYEFIVEIDVDKGDVAGACDKLREKAAYFQIISRSQHKEGQSIKNVFSFNFSKSPEGDLFSLSIS